VSSREDRGRYRGRRRAPSPPYTRYAVVVTGAFLGAGVVAMGTAAALPGTSSDTGLTASSASGAFTVADLNARQAAADRANRATDRTGPTTPDAVDAGLWLLPLHNYTVAAPFGAHAGVHPGVSLAAQEGTPFVAAHSGKVVLARYSGGLGLTVVIDTGNGMTITYGHASRLLVHEGQQVQAGDLVGLVGSSGYTYGSALYYEVQRDGKQIDVVAFMLTKGVDLTKATEAVNS
jgi:murein DD-endopeptidase MepM/ murein hydrolase activator NlpD